MASYKLLIKPSALKELEALPKRDRQRIITRIRVLASDPRPSACENLTGHELHRFRQGNYRVLYSVNDSSQELTIIKIGHRKDVHK